MNTYALPALSKAAKARHSRAFAVASLTLGSLCLPGRGWSESLDLADGWRFRTDPRHAGTTGRWDGVSLDDRRWTWTDTRGPWEERGAPGFRGAAWYRRPVDLAAPWSRVVLVLPGLRGRADIFVNGTAVALGVAPGDAPAVVTDLTAAVKGRSRFLLALRIVADAAGGGFAGPGVSLVADPEPYLVTPAARLGFLARSAPALPWPPALRGRGDAWVAAGGEGGTVLMAEGGRMVTGDRTCAVSCWLYDRGAGKFYAPEASAGPLTLAERYLPLPVMTSHAGKFTLSLALWPRPEPAAEAPPVAIGEAVVYNGADRPREVELIFAVHPFVAGAVAPIRSVAWDAETQAMLVDGRPEVVFPGRPDAVGVAPFGQDWALARDVAHGVLPAAAAVEDPEGLASGVVVYQLRLQPFGPHTQTFRIFLGAPPPKLSPDVLASIREMDRKIGSREAAAGWRRRLTGKGMLFLRVPATEKGAQDAFYASLGHLLTALDAGAVAPGDLALARAAVARTGGSDWTDTAVDVVPAAPPGRADPAEWTAGGAWRPAAALALAAAAARAGDGNRAGAILGWCLAHQTAPGAFAWSTAADPATGRWAGGALPDPRAAALYLVTLRDMLVREEDGALLLTPAVPESWVRPGSQLEVRRAPTAFGVLPWLVLASTPGRMSLRLLSAEKLANKGRGPVVAPAELAAPPRGLRWCIPGTRKIRQILLDGGLHRAVPADRRLDLPPGVRQVTVIW